MFSSKNLPIMPTLCSKLAYYAGIMLDALACLLCLKLCRHNRRMPTVHIQAKTTRTHIKADITFTNGRNFTGISRISSDKQLFSVLLKHHMAEYVHEITSYIPKLPMSTNLHNTPFSKISLYISHHLLQCLLSYTP